MQEISHSAGDARPGSATIVHLPDPRLPGPYRPFRDPGWSEAWWWLGYPVGVAIFVFATFWLDRPFYERWVIPEGYGVLEFTQFAIMVLGFFLGLAICFDPFVRRRRWMFALAILGTLSCLYIAGEEMSWGQHFFHWNTPAYWDEVNRQHETNLHNTYPIFEKWPRAIVELGIFIGGILLPLVAVFDPRVRANRLSIFLPAAALVPVSLGAGFFKLIDIAYQKELTPELLMRPSETVESYLYFFIFAYLIVYWRRIRQLKREEGSS